MTPWGFSMQLLISYFSWRPVAVAKAVAKLFVAFKMEKLHLNMEIIILVFWELVSISVI